jgi:hypothetical protein
MELEQAQTAKTQAKYFRDELFGSADFEKGMRDAGAGLGAVAGLAIAGKMAATGAAAGSVVGPVGTIVGALGGLIVGGALGLGTAKLHDVFAPEKDEITRDATGLSKEDYLKFAAAA